MCGILRCFLVKEGQLSPFFAVFDVDSRHSFADITGKFIGKTSGKITKLLNAYELLAVFVISTMN